MVVITFSPIEHIVSEKILLSKKLTKYGEYDIHRKDVIWKTKVSLVENKE